MNNKCIVRISQLDSVESYKHKNSINVEGGRLLTDWQKQSFFSLLVIFWCTWAWAVTSHSFGRPKQRTPKKRS